MGAHLSTQFGDGAFGMPFMKFTLTFDGSLPSSGNKAKNEEKWKIREQFHPQLIDLWNSHLALRFVEENKIFPKSGGATFAQAHHQYPSPIIPVQRIHVGPNPPPLSGSIDLCESIHKHGAGFRPLVRESFALHCGLKISFLRKEPPGKVYQGGDIDGRIKTLLDALTMPQHVEQVIEHNDETNPIYCLLEEDSLVSGFQVESERLLTGKDYRADFARVIIEVDVPVRQATIYNQSFLG